MSVIPAARSRSVVGRTYLSFGFSISSTAVSSTMAVAVTTTARSLSVTLVSKKPSSGSRSLMRANMAFAAGAASIEHASADLNSMRKTILPLAFVSPTSRSTWRSLIISSLFKFREISASNASIIVHPMSVPNFTSCASSSSSVRAVKRAIPTLTVNTRIPSAILPGHTFTTSASVNVTVLPFFLHSSCGEAPTLVICGFLSPATRTSW